VQTYIGPEALLVLLWGGVRLDRERYREVAQAPAATHLCLAMAALAGVARGFQLAAELKLTAAFLIIVGIAIALGGVVFESAIVWGLSRAVPRVTRASFGNVIRPLALATAPAVLYALIPLLPEQAPIAPVISLWLLLAFVVAIRAALDCGVGLAVVVAVLVRVVETAIDWGIQSL
jgi:hypothetical protein